MYNAEQGRHMIKLARAAIGHRLGEGGSPSAESDPDWLRSPGAVFVTLTHQGRLRGCIGSLEAYRSLRDDLEANACAAAFSDPRFAPVSRDEWPQIRVEVSVLARPEPLPCRDEADLLAQLRPGIDGVILEYGRHRATFLPQVWDTLPDARQFIAQLKLKAGLEPGSWDEGFRFSRYRVEKFKEESE